MDYIERADKANALVADMDEDTARSVFYAMQIKFGWAGTFFGRGDAEVTDPDGFDDHDLEITDAEWAVLSTSKDWGRYMVEAMCADLEKPYIERREDGSFGINYVLGVQDWYTADGTPIEEEEN